MFGPLQVRALSKELWKLKSENLKRLILLSDSARWPATPAHPCTTLTQRGLSSPIFESRLNCILTNCMFGPPKLISENRLFEPKSIERALRERILKAQVMRRQLRRVQLTVRVRQACNPQPWNPSITISTSVHLNSPELLACNYYSSARCDMTSHYTHTIVEYSFQPQYYILSQHCSCEIHNECVI